MRTCAAFGSLLCTVERAYFRIYLALTLFPNPRLLRLFLARFCQCIYTPIVICHFRNRLPLRYRFNPHNDDVCSSIIVALCIFKCRGLKLVRSLPRMSSRVLNHIGNENNRECISDTGTTVRTDIITGCTLRITPMVPINNVN